MTDGALKVERTAGGAGRGKAAAVTLILEGLCGRLTCACAGDGRSRDSCGCGTAGFLWGSSFLEFLQVRTAPPRGPPAGTRKYTALNINTDQMSIKRVFITTGDRWD